MESYWDGYEQGEFFPKPVYHLHDWFIAPGYCISQEPYSLTGYRSKKEQDWTGKRNEEDYITTSSLVKQDFVKGRVETINSIYILHKRMF